MVQRLLCSKSCLKGGEENMKKLILLTMLLTMLLTLISCAHTKVCPECPASPPEDVIVMHPGFPEYGVPPMPMKIEEGSMVPENYWTMDEWNKEVEKYNLKMKKEQGL